MNEGSTSFSPTIGAHDREVLRGLAERIAEIASLPLQTKRMRLVMNSNDLHPQRPIVLWQGLQACWRELIPDSSLLCKDHLMREWEQMLRQKIFRHENVPTDNPITAEFVIQKAVTIGSIGVETEFTGEERRRTNTGSYRWDASLLSEADLRKLHRPRIDYDGEETMRKAEVAAEIFGDLIDIRTKLAMRWSYGLTEQLIYLRGFEQTMIDLYEHPRLVHSLMAFLRDTALYELEKLQTRGLLTLNNGPEDIVTNGLGISDDLPAAGYTGKARLQDLWILSESQEFTSVGPDQFEEFALSYQIPVIERFGLCAYGCCEPLDYKFDLIIDKIPNLRRVSVSPWANLRCAAEKLGNRYVYSWKPNPSRICTRIPDFDSAKKDVVEALDEAKDCCLQIILNDTPTFHGDPTRLTRWVDMIMNQIN